MTSIERTSVVYRVARAEESDAALALDNSFTTDSVIEVTSTDDGFRLREVAVDPPLRKVFPDDEEDDGADGGGEEGGPDDGTSTTRVVVALDGDGALCGAITTEFTAWNSRLVIADVRVAPGHRGRGVGRGLMDRALDHGRELGARTAWLEVTNVNAPAVRAYRRMGFTLCGVDVTLYTGTASEGEQALFMSRPLTT
ncbi:GNAT family N-acetyltransferase [Streptomyces netropsis]|uniref:GNAT family N-acetyltransferase n=1 Tax=Streptomyces netropsis TaxID=55404 RepID=UPI0037960F6F